MGKSSINGPFSMAMLNSQRVISYKFERFWLMLNDDLDDVGHLSTSLLGLPKPVRSISTPKRNMLANGKSSSQVGWKKRRELNWIDSWEKRVKPLQFCPKPLLGKKWNSTGCGVSLPACSAKRSAAFEARSASASKTSDKPLLARG